MIANKVTCLNEAVLKTFFFEGMLQGSFFNQQKEPISGPFLGWSMDVFEYDHLPLKLTNSWGPNPECESFVTGRITISFNGESIWAMRYEGRYQEEATAVVRDVLGTTYQANYWQGGRGASTTGISGLSYLNNMTANTFSRFAGREEVRREENQISLGWYYYWGGFTL